jgi:hypothetical protein
MNPETPLKRAILDGLRAMGIEAWSTPAGRVRNAVHMAPRGTPDVLGYLPGGTMLALEVKVPGEQPKPHQAAWLERASKAGVVAAVVHSVQEMVHVVTRARPR